MKRRKGLKVILIILAFIICAIFISQIVAHTPDIKDKDGNKVKNSITELKKINVNGHEEWISIRGYNKDAPVLLFLSGGPGGTQLAATRHELSELEKHFVVVNWDQPGSGKSYNCMERDEIKIDTYIKDGTYIADYLRKEFDKEKIFLMGESWGSALGIFLISEKPENYHSFIGTGQMVDFKETEIIDYNFALEDAEKKGDKDVVEKLKKQGEPPYYDGNIALLSATYLQYLSSYMNKNPEIKNSGYNTFRDMFSSEYGLLDSVNYMLGIMNTFNVVYPQLYDIDLREKYSKVEVPVYFFIGRHDVNAPTSLVEDYYNILDAPNKELLWFENSGHSPWINETDKFISETIRVFNVE